MLRGVMAKKDKETNDKKEEFSGQVTLPKKIQRMLKVKELLDKGKKYEEIAKELGCSIATISLDKKYLNQIAISDLTGQDIAKIRSDLFLELTAIEQLAMVEFEKHRDKDPKVAKGYLVAAKETIESKARMFGVLEIKTPDTIINQQINSSTPTIKSPRLRNRTLSCSVLICK